MAYQYNKVFLYYIATIEFIFIMCGDLNQENRCRGGKVLTQLSFRPKAEASALADAEKSSGRGRDLLWANMHNDRASIQNGT